MSDTSKNKTSQPTTPTSKNNEQKKVRLIIDEIGRDTKTGIIGKGYSYDNGATFHVLDTIYGRLYGNGDGDAIWKLLHPRVSDRVKKMVDSATAEIPQAVSNANEAVKKADSAVANSKVNSDAIVAQSEAISEAKAAMERATAEIQQTASNAASDAAKIRADVAQVQNEVDTAKAANSASVEALKSDVSAAKQDLSDVHDSLDKAQSAIEQNQKLINDSVTKITSDVSATKQDLADVHDSLTKAQAAAEQNQKAINDSIAQINANVDATNQDLAGVRKDLTKAQSDITANQKVVNDNVAQINSNIEQDRKDIASAQQANADTAKQLGTYSKQATEQGKTIKTIQDKQDGFTATLADVQGNVSQVSDKVDGLSASLKDTQGNVASVKAQADQLSATLTNHGKSIATLIASAKELSSTLEDANGRLSKVEQTAQTNSSTLSDVQGDLSQVKQDATTLTATLKDAQGNISTLQQKADSVSAQLASAQGDIATLQTDVDGVKATLTSHDKSIHTLQADSKSLKDSMVNAQGDISTLRKTATDVTSELEDHTGRLSKVEQSAATQATTLSDLQGNLTQVKQKADSNTATISSISKNAMQDRGAITDTKTSFDSLTQLGTYSIKASGLPKMPEQHYGTLVVSGSAGSGWLSQQFVADTTGNVYTRVFSNNVWSAWKQGGSQDAINQVKQTADSNSATIRNVQGDVSTLKQTATGIKSTLASHEGDIHTLQADSKSLKDRMTNAQGDISTLQKSATSLDSEMKDHAGRLSKVEQSAATQATTLSDLQGNLTQVKQQADGLVTTLKDAQGSITQIQQKADGTLAQLKSAQGDIASLQTDVTGIKATLVSHEGDIHTLQADSKTLKDDMADAKGNISSLQKTSTSLVSEFKDHDGRISKTEQTASTLANEFSDQQGHLSRVEQTAQGTQQTVANQQGQINTIKTDVSGIHQTITGQGNQIATINVTLNGLNTKYEGVSGDLGKLKSQVQWATVKSAVDLNNVKTPCHEFLKGRVTNAPNEVAWWYLTVEGSESGRITQTVIADQSNNRYTRRWADGWSAWVKDATQTDVTALSDRITTNSTQITQNKQAIALKADQSTVNNLSGEVSQNKAQLKIQAGQISSKVSSTEYQTLKGKVDGMQIGGRNVLRNTDPKQIDKIESDSTWILGSGGNGSARTISLPNTFSAKQGFEIYGNAAGNRDFTQRPIHWTKNRYIFSIYARIADGSTVKSVDMLTRAYSNQVNRAVFENHHNLTSSSWERVVLPIDASSFYTQSGVSMAFGLAGPGSIDFAQPMLEIATTPSMWSPAPEDAITAIQKNSTAIDQTNKQISLKADQTEVDKVKQTASQNSSRLDILAGEVKSKVDETRVNNIVDGKGYATTSTVQSLVDQKAGTINESITNLTTELKNNNGGGVNLLKGTKDFRPDSIWFPLGAWVRTNDTYNGLTIFKGKATEDWSGLTQYYSVKAGETYTFSLNARYESGSGSSTLFIMLNVDPENGHKAAWVSPVTRYITLNEDWQRYSITFSVNSDGYIKPRIERGPNNKNVLEICGFKLERGSVATPWTPAPSDNATVTQVQQITASIDGIQSTVANKADKSQITQLSNMIQSKVSSSDFNDLKDKTTWKSADRIDLNTAVSQQKIFVKGGSNLPPGRYWWYVRVEPGYDSRVVQYAVSDRDNIHYSRQYNGKQWTAWSQGATESEITQLRDDINLRVKSGDLLSQINLEAGQTLIQSKKLYLDADTVAFSGKAFIPSAAITSLDADKITSGYIKVPMSDGNGNSVQVSNNGVDIVSNNQNTKLFSANRGIASVHIDAAGMNFGATTNGTYELLGGLSPLLDDTDGDFGGMSNHNGIGFVVETQQQYGSPYGGDFFSLARSIKGPPSYYNGFLYEATGSGKHEIGSHFFDPIYVHPWGADNYMHATWVSWTAWDNNEKYPAIVQAGSNMGGICFPKSGEVTLFTASGKSFTPSQWKGAYTGYQHGGAGNAYHDPSQGA